MNRGHEDNEGVSRFSGKELPDSLVMPVTVRALEVTAPKVAAPCCL